jgi:hypothetical protein
MQVVSRGVIWLSSHIRVIFSDDALNGSGDVARTAHSVRSDRRHYVT